MAGRLAQVVLQRTMATAARFDIAHHTREIETQLKPARHILRERKLAATHHEQLIEATELVVLRRQRSEHARVLRRELERMTIERHGKLRIAELVGRHTR